MSEIKKAIKTDEELQQMIAETDSGVCNPTGSLTCLFWNSR